MKGVSAISTQLTIDDHFAIRNPKSEIPARAFATDGNLLKSVCGKNNADVNAS